MSLLVIFNIVVYSLFNTHYFDAPEEIQIDRAATPDELQIEQAQDARALSRLENVLYLTDGITVFLVAVVSYIFAGRALRPIEEAYERQKKFVADVAHELRTPLSVLKTGAEMVLLDHSGTESAKKFVSEALEEVDHLSAITEDLLFLAQSDERSRPSFVRVNLSRLADGLCDAFEPLALKKGLWLEREIDPGAELSGNPTHLKRLLSNLIQNGIAYTSEGTIRVSVKKRPGAIEMGVADTGIGIKPEDVKKIFDRFYKVETSRTQSAGAGLGLSIVREVAEAHRGRIKVESLPGKGTVFSVVFSEIAE